MNDRPFVAITMGDPSGIGPEVTAKALMDRRVYQKCRPFVVGSASAMDDALRIIQAPVSTHVAHSLEDVVGSPEAVDVLDLENLDFHAIEYGKLSAVAGKASVEWILKAGEMAAAGLVQAIATAPINKEACSLAGYKDVGHMEIFQSQTGAKEVATMLMAGTLRVVHLTTHRSVRVACDYVTKDNVLAKIRLTAENFGEWGFSSPRIGGADLHLLLVAQQASVAGVRVQSGHAVEEAKARGIDATGPVPADTVFNQAIDGKYDAVLAMYHDQGHIPIKVHDWAKSVSVNLGLPFIPDLGRPRHGLRHRRKRRC